MSSFLPLNASSVYPLGERKAQYRTVSRVVDGDTIVLENKERVRLIGVDTPETKHLRKPVEYFGEKATALTKKMVQGKRVDWSLARPTPTLDTKTATEEHSPTCSWKTEPSSTLRSSFKQGYGFAYTRFPFEYMEKFRRYEREAREQDRSLWKNHQSRQRASVATRSRGGLLLYVSNIIAIGPLRTPKELAVSGSFWL